MNLKIMWNTAPLILAAANVNSINIQDKDQNQHQKQHSWFDFLNLEGGLSKNSRGNNRDKKAWDRFGEESDFELYNFNQNLKEKAIEIISEHFVNPEISGQELINEINYKLQQISSNISVKSKWNNLHGKVKSSDHCFHFYINNSWYFDFNVYLKFLGNKWNFYFWGKETDRHININFV